MLQDKVLKTGVHSIPPNAASSLLLANYAFYRHEALKIVNGQGSAPPAGPYAQGEAYLIRGAFPTGDWSGFGGYIVFWYANHWCPIAPVYGMTVTDQSVGAVYTYAATNEWICLRASINLGTIASGSLSIDCAEGNVFKLVVTGAFTLDAPTRMQNGTTYQLMLHNNSGSHRNVTFASGGWVVTTNPLSALTSYRTYIRFMKLPGTSRAIITHSQNGLIGSPA